MVDVATPHFFAARIEEVKLGLVKTALLFFVTLFFFDPFKVEGRITCTLPYPFECLTT